MNDSIVLRNIAYVGALDIEEVTGLALDILEMPQVKAAIRDGERGVCEHAIMLHDAEADTWARTHNLRDRAITYEHLRAALYLYAIHYPGTVAAVIGHKK